MSLVSKILLIILLLTSGFLLPVQPTSAATLTRPPNNLGLVGYWPMDEGVGSVVGDASGNGKHGVITDGTWANGKKGKALSFNGSSAYVNVGSITAATNMTISGWVKKDASTSQKSFFSNRSGGGRVYFGLSGTRIFLYDNSGSPPSALSASGVVTMGEWQHITATSNGSATVFYLNGKEVISIDQVRTSSTGTTWLARDPSIPSEYWDGQIDDLRVYNRALSPTDVSALYNSGQVTRRAPSNTGLVGYWALNEGRGSQAGDSSGNGNTGTITGASWTNGKRGGALSFNGTSDYVQVSASANFDIKDVSEKPYTVSAWVKPTRSPSDSQSIFSIGTTHYNSVSFALDKDEKLFMVASQTGGSWQIVNKSTNTVSLNEWSYITFTRNSSGEHKFYIDGADAGGGFTSANDIRIDQNIAKVGAHYAFTAGYYYGGLVDDIRFYNRALSATEISALYGTGQVVHNAGQNDKLTDGLVGLWSFNGYDMDNSSSTAEVLDRSGNGNNGDNVGATVTQGKVGQALSFDGNDYVKVGENPNLAPSLMSAFLWVKANNWDTDVATALLTKRTYPSNITGYFFFVLDTSKKVNIDVGDGAQTRFDTNYTPPTGEWLHLGYTYDGHYIRFYVNGVLNATSSDLNKSYGDSGTNLYIGANQVGNAYFFDGSIDEVRIYNRALSADEVKQLYNMGK